MFRKRLYSTVTKNTSIASKVLYFVIGSTVFVGSTGYLATKVETFKKVWLELPFGQESLEMITKAETLVKTVNYDQVQSNITARATYLKNQLAELKTELDNTIDSSVDTIATARKSAEEGYQKTMQTIYDTTQCALKVYDSISDTVTSTMDQSAKSVQSGINAVKETYDKVHDQVEDIVSTAKDKVDSFHSMVTGEPNKAVLKPKVVQQVSESTPVPRVNVELPKEEVDTAPIAKQNAEPLEEDNIAQVPKETSETPNEGVDITAVANDKIETSKEDIILPPAHFTIEKSNESLKEEVIVEVQVAELHVPVEELDPSNEAMKSESLIDDQTTVQIQETKEPFEPKFEDPKLPHPGKASEIIPTLDLALDQTPVVNPDTTIIPVKISLPTNDPLIPTLVNEMKQLSVSLMKLADDPSSSSKSIIESAQHLDRLTEFLNYLEAQEMAHLATEFKSQTEKFYSDIKVLQNDLDAQLKEQSTNFANEIAQLQLEQQKLHEVELQTKLQEQAHEFEVKLSESLKNLQIELDVYWTNQVKERIDSERQGRLARLDYLALKVKHLELTTIEGSQYLDRLQTITNLQQVLIQLKEKVSQPSKVRFSNELSKLKEMGKHDPLIQVAFGPIDSKCETEFMTSYELIQDFHKIKTPIMQNQLLPLEAGPISYITSRFLYYFLAPKKGFVNGNDTSSILARCQYLLEKNDMQGALEQVNQLAGWSRLLADDWIQKMIQHVELMQAIQVVDTRLALKSLGVIQ